jgi:hypothetical protein
MVIIRLVGWRWAAMVVPRRTTGRLWAGRVAAGLVLVGLAIYLVSVGLDKADKISSCLSLLLAAGLALAPYLLPTAGEEQRRLEPDHIEGTGTPIAEGGATSVTGAQVTEGSGLVRVKDTGDAYASGHGSTAVSGIQRLPRTGQ